MTGFAKSGLLALLLLVVLASQASALLSKDPSCGPALDSSFLSEKGAFRLSWSLVNNNTAVVMEMSAKAEGYLAIGFGFAMPKSDMIIGWVDNNGNVQLRDRFAVEHTEPAEDTDLGGTNDVQVVCGMRNNGVTTIRFKRLLNTSDPYDMVLPPKGPIDVIYAFKTDMPGVLIHHGLDNHNHIVIDLSQRDGRPDTEFGDEEHGLSARQMLRRTLCGTLITLQAGTPGNQASGFNGHPYGSIACFADNEPSTGMPLLLLTEIELNVINSNADPRVALAISTPLDQLDGNDPMIMPRMTLMGTLQPVEYQDIAAAKKVYVAKHPQSAMWINFIDFSLFYLDVTDVYWVGGFGDSHYIGWIDSETYKAQKVQ